MRVSHARAHETEDRSRRAIREPDAQLPVEHHDTERKRAHERIESIVDLHTRLGRRIRVCGAHLRAAKCTNAKRRCGTEDKRPRDKQPRIDSHYSLNM